MSEDIINDTKTFLENLTEQERYELDLIHLRFVRNRLLEQSDNYMSQIDRFTTTQILEMKEYRQKLRDITTDYKDSIGKEYVPLPEKPDFIK